MNENEKIDVMAIGAHPDDVEITCGGTLFKLSNMGYKIAIVDLTKGEMGSRGNVSIRTKEAECARKTLGAKVRINLELSDSFLENERETKAKVVKTLRRYRPRLLFLPHRKQRHPDHRKTSEIVYDSCHLSGLEEYRTGSLKPFRPHKIIYCTSFLAVEPSIIIDISDSMEGKLNAVRCYKSQFEPIDGEMVVYPPAFDMEDYILTDARYYGYKASVKYGEPFYIPEPILIENPLLMKVPSI